MVGWIRAPQRCPHPNSQNLWICSGVSNRPGRRPVLVCGLLGTRLHSRRWATGKWAKLHLYLQPLLIAHVTAWAPPPVRSAVALDSHRSANPTVNCVCQGSRLHVPYENLMPDDLRWSWGGDASAGEQLQIQIIISRGFDCTETKINQLLVDSCQSPISEWQVKTRSGLPLILHYGELYNYFIIYYNVMIIEIGTSLVVQWLRIHLPKQGTQVRALVWEDPTCHGATKPVHHNYWACALKPASHIYWVHMPQLLKPAHLEPMLHNKRSHHNEKPTHRNKE